jgi:hypothetical protein
METVCEDLPEANHSQEDNPVITCACGELKEGLGSADNNYPCILCNGVMMECCKRVVEPIEGCGCCSRCVIAYFFETVFEADDYDDPLQFFDNDNNILQTAIMNFFPSMISECVSSYLCHLESRLKFAIDNLHSSKFIHL